MGAMLFSTLTGWSQEEGESSLLFAYQRNFARGSLSTKVQVLQDAAESGETGMGKLYLQALQFFLDNIGTLSGDATAHELAKLAVRLLGREGYAPAKELLWQAFSAGEDTGIRVAVVSSLGELLDAGDPLLEKMHAFMSLQHENFLDGKPVDQQVVSEMLVSFGKIGAADSFPLVFAALHIGYPDFVKQKALDALEKLEGNIADMVKQVLERGFPREKLPVLEWAMEKDTFSREQKGEIALKALEVGLESTSNEEINKMLRDLRCAAVDYLAELEWSGASPLMIKHFDQTNVEVDRGMADPSNLLRAIAALGAMGTHEAAVRLSLYLEVLNTYRENGQNVDEQVVLAVIRNIGKLGDNVAFDHLLYTMYLDYPRTVKQAAREVLSELKQ
jgi:hypothetical protein